MSVRQSTVKESVTQNHAGSTQLKKPKGSQCSVNGNLYEKQIHDIIAHCSIEDKPFHTQKEKDLAGCSCKIDIECNFNDKMDIGIEVKKHKSPDWMQCSIKYHKETRKWQVTDKGKHLFQCREMFNKFLNELHLYNGEIPPFMEKPITHEQWIKIKSETDKWNDKYIDIPPDSISKLYEAKGCKYIQISDGFGLYHLGNDICNFGVPLFKIEQQLRIRTKIHNRKNKKGFCNLSVTVACRPKDINGLECSKFSLDNKNTLPVCMKYQV